MINLKTLIGPASAGDHSTTFNAVNLADADDSIAIVVCVPKDGSITKVGCYFSGIVGNPPAYNISLVTIDAGGLPTTTNYGGCSTDPIDPTGAGWIWITLGTPAAAVAGDVIAVRIWPTATAPDASNYAIARRAGGPFGFSTALPRSMLFTTSWTGTANPYALALEYSDGMVVGCPITSAADTASIGTGSTPDEMGMLFTLPLAVVCIGCRIGVAATWANEAITVQLIGPDGSTVLASWALADEDIGFILGPTAPINGYWDPVTLPAGAGYRLTIKPESATAGFALKQVLAESANSRNAFPEGANWQYTQRVDGGAFSQPDATVLLWMAIWASQVDVAKTLAAAAA